jgi:hypothetical protein
MCNLGAHQRVGAILPEQGRASAGAPHCSVHELSANHDCQHDGREQGPEQRAVGGAGAYAENGSAPAIAEVVHVALLRRRQSLAQRKQASGEECRPLGQKGRLKLLGIALRAKRIDVGGGAVSDGFGVGRDREKAEAAFSTGCGGTLPLSGLGVERHGGGGQRLHEYVELYGLETFGDVLRDASACCRVVLGPAPRAAHSQQGDHMLWVL